MCVILNKEKHTQVKMVYTSKYIGDRVSPVSSQGSRVLEGG